MRGMSRLVWLKTESINEIHERQVNLEEKEKPQQDKTYLAAEEIYTTEKAFNQILHLLYFDFRESILELKILPHAEFEKIFSNIVQIRLFSDTLMKELQERIKAWDIKTSKIADIFVRIGPFIK